MAKVNPTLYRSMHSYALAHFEEAKAYYHVTTDMSKIVPLAGVSDVFYQTLSEQEEAFEQSLISHIGKHLSLLGK